MSYARARALGERYMKRVITYGSFDLFHEGHYNLLRRAKALGDYLIVGVTTEYYDKHRGKMNVVDPLLERVENVRKTGFADEIIIEDHEGQKIEDIQKYGIDVFTVGSDWAGQFDYLKEFCGVVYIERTKGVSSTMLRSQKQGIINLGIVGSGRIARRFVPEAKYVSGVNVSAVYNPRLAGAEAFERLFELGLATDDFKEFLRSVDAVYIAAPHETHYEYAKGALESGKHVLCEKPITLNGEQARELFNLAAQRGLVLMEAVKTAYLPGFINLVNISKGGRIGTIYDVEACFTSLRKNNKREWKPERFGGSLTEFGTYPLFVILKLCGTGYESVTFDTFLNKKGIDIYTKVHLKYPDKIATAKAGLGVKSEGQLIVSGTNGYILAESPWWLTKSFEVCYENREQNERFFTNYKGEGLRYEISEFVVNINNGKANDSNKALSKESICMADIVERFLAREGVNIFRV